MIMQYVVNDLMNLSEQDINAINYDSCLSINELGSIQAIFDHDHISWFRHIRIYNTYFQFKGNLDSNMLDTLVKYREVGTKAAFKTISLHERVTYTKMTNNCTALEFKKSFNNFKDIFIFDIQNHYYQNLSFQAYLSLHERLQQLIDLIYLNTTFMMKITLTKTSNRILSIPQKFKNNANYLSIKEKFSLTDNELYYLNAIAISGSSKEVAKAIGKSPRTIEKMIASLCKKLSINNKFSLQLFAKILASKAEITQLNTQEKETCDIA